MEENVKLIALLERLRPHVKRKYFDVSLPSGWVHLVNRLHVLLFELDPNYQLLQVKEKFGGLRFYATTTIHHADFQETIDYHESHSHYVCQKCGETGRLREDLSWIKTLCEAHYLEELSQNESSRSS